MPQPGWVTRGVVRRVIDGDTLVVEIRRTIRVRLLDCWAPETRSKDEDCKAAGLAAKEFLEKFLPEGNDVIVEIPTDQEGENGDLASVLTMGRVLGNVWNSYKGEDVAKMMVKSGHATQSKAELEERGLYG